MKKSWTIFDKFLIAVLFGWVLLIALFVSAGKASASDSLWLSNIGQQATGTTVTGKNGLDVNVISPITASALNVSPTASAVPANAGYIGGNKSGNLTGLLIGQQIMANSLACTLPSDQSAIPVTGTFWQATQPVSGTVTANQGTAVAAASGWPVKPTDGTNSQSYTASGEAKVSLTTSIPGGSNTIGTVNVNTIPSQAATGSTVPSSAIQIGVKNGSNLVAVTQGSTTGANSIPVVIASDQGALPTKSPVNATASGSSSTISTTAGTLSAPSNTVGFILQNISTSTANVRYLVGGTAVTTSTGIQLAPGQDTGFVPAGSNISIIAESGTQSYAVQWVSQ
jgi:hypothetical protein